MAEERVTLDELLEIVRGADMDTVSAAVHRLVRFPPPLQPVEHALDNLLRFAGTTRDDDTKELILKVLVDTIRGWLEDEQGWVRHIPEDYLKLGWEEWHRLAQTWCDVWREALDLAIEQLEQDETRVEPLMSLTRAFGMWFHLLSLCARRPLRWFPSLTELVRALQVLIWQIGRIETGHYKAEALEGSYHLVRAVSAATDFEEALSYVERVSRDFGEPAGDDARVESLWLTRGILDRKSVAARLPMMKPASPSEEVSAVPPTEPLPRYADFAFHYDERHRRGQRVPDRHTLQAGQWYQLEIAVRVKPIGIPPEELERIPIREPEQKQDVTIMVTTESAGFEIAEPVQMLTLPPLGDSTENALFRVRPLRESTNVDDLAEIKVRLYYEFNLLEVALIRAEVVGKFDSPAQSQLGLDKPISFRQERLEREYIDFDNVQPRSMHIDITKRGDYFLFTFAFYNAIDQEVVFTAPARLPASGLEDDLISIRKIWYDIAMSQTFTEQLEGGEDEFLANVRRLARAGRRLWIKLFKRERRSSMYRIGAWLERHPLEQDGIIQVSLHEDAASFVFPWALIYDRPVPRKEHELPDLEGFWGVRYCIEQQLPNIIKGTDEPVHLEEELKLEFMLWEQFRNADKQKSLMRRLMAQRAGWLRVSTPPITDADACYDLLSDCDSHVLYFYTHGYTRHRQADIGVGPDLELFVRRYERLDKDSPLRETYRLLYQSIRQEKFEPDRSWIELTYGKLYLDELYDYVGNLQSGPFVILNMCESAQITPALSDSFFHFFLDRGATGVMGTECPMTLEFAHPFAEEFLTDMLAGEQVGIALLNARRHFLELKNPLGLAYTLFGSATVCFVPPRL